jgi:hypothetical protein
MLPSLAHAASGSNVEGKPHGAFSSALLAALQQTRGSISYRDLATQRNRGPTTEVKYPICRAVEQAIV